MPELTLLCSRPHVRDVDFRNSRFVVSTGVGLNVDGVHLEMGDEVPPGSLNEYALASEYDATRRIEVLDYAMTLPHLREACARRGVVVEAPQPYVFIPDLSELTVEELTELCSEQGLPTGGNAKALRRRLEAHFKK